MTYALSSPHAPMPHCEAPLDYNFNFKVRTDLLLLCASNQSASKHIEQQQQRQHKKEKEEEEQEEGAHLPPLASPPEAWSGQHRSQVIASNVCLLSCLIFSSSSSSFSIDFCIVKIRMPIPIGCMHKRGGKEEGGRVWKCRIQWISVFAVAFVAEREREREVM